MAIASSFRLFLRAMPCYTKHVPLSLESKHHQQAYGILHDFDHSIIIVLLTMARLASPTNEKHRSFNCRHFFNNLISFSITV